MKQKIAQMRQVATSETMGVVLLVWLCSLLVIGLVVVPLFGVRTAWGVALGLLVVMLAACWGACIWRMPHK